MKTISAKKKVVRRKRAADRAKWHLRRAGKLQILEAAPLTRIRWITHGFSTRTAGGSSLESSRDGKVANQKVLNLGFTAWDSRQHVLGNRKKFFAATGVDKMRIVTLRQIHSDIVHTAYGSDSAQTPEACQGDALITRERGLLLAVQTADCVPILLADTKHRAIAAVHAGWRGTLRRIAEKTLGRMQMEFGTRPENVTAALGPGIGVCCFEVGHEVVKEFQAQFPNAREWFDGPFDALALDDNDPNWLPWLTMMPPGHQSPPPRARLDLLAANRAILVAAGVPAKNVSSSGFCTACRTDLFFSYRRERVTGRMMAVIGIR